jgi:hypothetical protein
LVKRQLSIVQPTPVTLNAVATLEKFPTNHRLVM